MSHRLCITISREQYAFLNTESDRSSVSMAELVRRALDTVFGPRGERKVVEISHSTGRRPGRHID
jgi:hypothetical protein